MTLLAHPSQVQVQTIPSPRIKGNYKDFLFYLDSIWIFGFLGLQTSKIGKSQLAPKKGYDNGCIAILTASRDFERMNKIPKL